jgi:hypothetical protein
MFKYRLHWSATIWLALPSLVGLPLCASAQDHKRVTIALATALPDTAAIATIIREAGAHGRTLIVLREQNVDAATIATAFASLTNSRRKNGETLTNEMVIALHGTRPPSSLTAEEQRVIADYVSRLRNAKLEELEGVGLARTLDVELAPLARHGGG